VIKKIPKKRCGVGYRATIDHFESANPYKKYDVKPKKNSLRTCYLLQNFTCLIGNLHLRMRRQVHQNSTISGIVVSSYQRAMCNSKCVNALQDFVVP